MNTDIVPGIIPGIIHTLSLHVNDRLLVTAFTPDFSGFADLPPVFGTAFMVGFMEWACIEALKPYLEDGWKTVGTHVYLSHVSPTPGGHESHRQCRTAGSEGPHPALPGGLL